MGFEEFAVGLYPKETSSFQMGNSVQRFRGVIAEIRQRWPTLYPDELEIARAIHPKRPEDEILVSETKEGIFQMFLKLGNLRDDDIFVSLKFAYSNPRSVYEQFCCLVEWLMIEYSLYCHIATDLAPGQQDQDEDIVDVSRLRSVLICCMDYNRNLWHLEAQTEEEAVLRPGDAVERFIIPLLQT